jgi:phospholipid N-methyltransferase
MRQLWFWDESAPVSSPPAGDRPVLATAGTRQKENKSAIRCRLSADALQKHIDAKHRSANNMFVLPPTRKRLNEASSLRKEAIRLERLQATLRRLADMHEDGSIEPELANFTTKGTLESALFTLPGTSAIHRLYQSVKRDEQRQERVIRLTSEARTMGIPSYFPTPESLADQLVSLSCIQPGNRILEPSAGSGNLIDAMLRSHQDMHVSYCELNCFLLEILRDKYAEIEGVGFVGRDVFDLDSNRIERFDRVIMNPPFENGEDADHVLHAWCSLLGAGGILTAIVSGGLFSRQDKKAKNFREFIRDEGARVHDIPAGSFKSSGTGVETKIVQVRVGGW